MRYAIVTDVHANYHALEAVDEDVRQLRAQDMDRPIAYWFLGDLIGYGPDPISCIRWLKGRANIDGRWLPGNHDEWLVRPSRVSNDATDSLRQHKALLSAPQYAGLNQWFCQAVATAVADEAHSIAHETFLQGDAVFVHGSVMKTLRRTTYLFPWKQYDLRDEFAQLQDFIGSAGRPTVLFCGHTHYPMWARQRGKAVAFESIKYFAPRPLGHGAMIINPGSVGQPRDGDQRAAYAIFDTENWTIEFRRVKYAVYNAVAELRNQGYPDSLAERLLSADGRADLQEYYTVYSRPQWDLEAINQMEESKDVFSTPSQS